MSTALRSIPLLIFIIVSYFAFAVVLQVPFNEPVIGAGLPSGSRWVMTLGDLHVIAGLALLYIEILKSTRTQLSSILDHGLSLLLFVVCLVLFIIMPAFGTGSFFVLTMMTLLDVVAGFTVTITSAKRDIDVGQPMH